MDSAWFLYFKLYLEEFHKPRLLWCIQFCWAVFSFTPFEWVMSIINMYKEFCVEFGSWGCSEFLVVQLEGKYFYLWWISYLQRLASKSYKTVERINIRLQAPEILTILNPLDSFMCSESRCLGAQRSKHGSQQLTQGGVVCVLGGLYCYLDKSRCQISRAW